MRSILKYFVLFVSFIYLNNCSTMNLEDYKNNEPKLILEDFFSGKTVARGVFEDRFGNIKKYFKVDIVGKWDGSTLILEENFFYNDGTKEFRKWTIKKDKAKSNFYSGYADGVVGLAEGSTNGNAFNWKYKFNLKIGDKTVKVDFDDWMFLQEKNYLINIARVKKFGITLGRVILFFEKE